MTSLRHTAVAAGLMLAAVAILPGCAAEVRPDIPSAAILNTEGTGRLIFTAPSPGTVYVYDDTDNRLVYSGEVDQDQRLTVSPVDSRIDLGDRKVSEDALEKGNRYQVYFEPKAVVQQRRVVETETRIERRD